MAEFRDILNKHGIAISEKRSSRGWIQFDCPFCGIPGSPGMGYNESSGAINCWKCGPHRMGEVLSALLRIPLPDAIDLSKTVFRKDHIAKVKPRGRLKTPRGVAPMGKAHRQYLRLRNFDPDEIERLWRVQGIGLAAKLAWRLFIPIHLNGEMVSWTTRAIGKSSIRYHSASPEEESIHHKDLLYGEDYCRHAVIIHEGPTDVWRTGPGAVSTFGTSFSSEQVLRMLKYPTRIVCFDSEDEAQKRAAMLCEQLEPFPGRTINIQLDADDPGSASPKEVRQLRKLLKR